MRLYVDSKWDLDENSHEATDGEAWLRLASRLNTAIITDSIVTGDGALVLLTDAGRLTVSGLPEAYTVGEPWSLSPVSE